MPPKTSGPNNPTATTPEDNNYCSQAGTYDDAYCGDLTERGNQEEFEERDARVDATRSEFAKTPAPKGAD